MTTDARYHRQRPTTTRRRRPPSSARDRARLIVALDGRTWAVAEDHETEAELQALAARIAAVLVEYVGAA